MILGFRRVLYFERYEMRLNLKICLQEGKYVIKCFVV